MTTLAFISPLQLRDHFEIPIDEAEWRGRVGDYVLTTPDSRGKKYQTPDRHRATFSTLSKSLVPVTDQARSLKTHYGVYMLAFEIPFPAFYVGIAASSSKSPEGILSRIRKHRVKLTGSHIGSSIDKHGGVDHTGGWREFAIQRAQFCVERSTQDDVADARLSFADFMPSAGPAEHKKEAEWFESQLTGNPGWNEAVVRRLWPNHDPSSIFQLTRGKSSGLRPATPVVRLWDGSELTA